MTLPELCAAVAVSAVLLLAGTASFHEIRSLQQTACITSVLTQTLYNAREQAVLRYQAVLILPIRHEWQNGWILQLESASGQKILNTYPPVTLPIIYKGFQQKINSIKVFPDGTTNGYQGHFEYAGKKLFINQGGRTRE